MIIYLYILLIDFYYLKPDFQKYYVNLNTSILPIVLL